MLEEHSLSSEIPQSLQQSLLEAARRGATEELGQLLQELRRHLLVVAEHQLDNRIRGRVSASDVVQDTLLEAHRDFPQFRGESIGEFLAWLRRILARNIARMIERHVLAEKRGVRREVSLETFSVNLERSALRLNQILASTRETPSTLLSNQERMLAVSNALAELPPDYRRVIMLRHLDGLSFPEIGEAMERTAGACRMLWFRAIDQLREALGDSV